MIQFIPDYKKRLKESTYSWWSRKGRIGAYIKAVASVFQTIEEDIYGVVFSLPVSQAGGATLDKWGDILGEQRLGLTDPAYRRVLRAKIAFLSASGVAPPILDAISTFTGDPEPSLERSSSGFMRIAYTGDLTVGEQTRLVRLIQDAPAAGFKEEIVQKSTDPFLFGDTFGKAFGSERIDD